MFELPIQ